MSILQRCILGLAYILCSPCIYYAEYSTQRRHDRRDGRRAPTGSKPAALRTRRRALTLPLLDRRSGRKRCPNAQSGSPLFSKLPFELREQIWKECVGGEMLHIYWSDRHTHGLVRQTPEDPRWSIDHSCWRSRQHEQRFLETRGLIALLLTCRRVYSEAIGVLYSDNLFDFSASYLCLLHLPNFLIPRRLNAISQVHFIWHLPHGPPNVARSREHNHYDKTWIGIWTNLSLLKGLRYLRVELDIMPVQARYWAQLEDEVWEPIKKVTIPQVFELVLPFPENPGGKVAKELPCRITRTQESLN